MHIGVDFAMTFGNSTSVQTIGVTNSVATLDIDTAYNVVAASCPDEAFSYQELYQAIDGLTVSERTAVLLFYMEDRPIKEISTIMNVAEGTVKAYLSRGREHLRTKLSK